MRWNKEIDFLEKGSKSLLVLKFNETRSKFCIYFYTQNFKRKIAGKRIITENVKHDWSWNVTFHVMILEQCVSKERDLADYESHFIHNGIYTGLYQRTVLGLISTKIFVHGKNLIKINSS